MHVLANQMWRRRAEWLEPILAAHVGTPFDVAVFESNPYVAKDGDTWTLSVDRAWEAVPAGTLPSGRKGMVCTVYQTSTHRRRTATMTHPMDAEGCEVAE